MSNQPRRISKPTLGLSRREWIIASLAGGIGLRAGSCRAEDDAGPEIAAVELRAKQVKLKGFRATKTEHYLGIGNAPDAYRKQALKICNSLAGAYFRHFRDKGFELELPQKRLTVVTLKDRQSYEAFLGEAVGAEVGGHYDLNTNRLVIFDFRPGDQGPDGLALRVNTFTLVHESIHQLTFNTGLLDRSQEIPVCVSEGLATYGEAWLPPPSRVPFGQVNSRRRDVLFLQSNPPWIPLGRLIADDSVFALNATSQLAYAESWLLIYYLMKRNKMLPKLRAYLKSLGQQHDAKLRLANAKDHLGDLELLDDDLRQYANTL